MAEPRDFDPLAATAASGAGDVSATDATMASDARGDVSSTDATLASGSGGAPTERGPVLARGGDYPELLTVEPRHYVIERELARGGMGRILVARDRRLGRTVALKELLSGSHALHARFEREARITSRLQHPGIVPVIEAGKWPGGEPFYAMKLVAGRPLDDVIAEAKTLRDRLALLPAILAACDALAYAHSERVIHRDLKPANVLVGDFGETVVIDWGLAKDLAADEPELPEATPYRASGKADDRTVAGAVLGTPAYMPPEQARGEPADARADVYALGAILYLALSGKRPYPQQTLDALLAALEAGPPAPLASVAPEVPADLAAIVDQAMAHDPKDRYPTARELTADLKRFQTGQLVGVHRYTTWQLVKRWARRHRAPLTIAGLAALIMLALVVVGVRRIMAERDRAEHERATADHSRVAAEDLIDFMMFELHDKLQAIGRLDLFDSVAHKALRYYDDNPSAQADAAARRRRAAAQRSIGDVLYARGDLAGARTRYQAAIDLIGAQPLADEDRGRVYLAARHSEIELSVKHGDPDAASKAYAALVAELDRDPRRDDWLEEARSVTTFRLGVALHGLGRERDAKVALARSVEIDRRRLAAHETPATLDTLESSLSRYGETQLALGELDAAQASFEESLRLAAQLVARSPNDADRLHSLAIAEFKLGELAERRKDLKAARTHYERARDDGLRLTQIDASNLQWQDLVSTTHSKIGDMQQELGDAKAAADEFRRYLEMAQAAAAADPSNQERRRALALAYVRTGQAKLAAHDRAGAIADYRRSIEIEEQRLAGGVAPDIFLDLGWTHRQLGFLAAEDKDDAGAVREFQASIDAGTKLLATAPSNPDFMIALTEDRYFLGKHHEDRARYDDAIATYRACIADLGALPRGDGKQNASVKNAQSDADNLWEAIARVELAAHRPAEAIAALNEAMALTEILVRDHPDESFRHDNATQPEKLGDALLAQGDRAGARAAYQRSIDEYVATKDDAAAAAVRKKLLAVR
ncbi:MAG TPA: protein kinase [Kofleriaceae bacterium]|nr:protein kinase [Kofleriaceae bacterium]